jgi:hypothetical protein
MPNALNMSVVRLATAENGLTAKSFGKNVVFLALNTRPLQLKDLL